MAADETLAGLTPPAPEWLSRRQYMDVAGGYYREVPAPAETLARAKVAYTETLVERMRDESWEGTPLRFNALLAAAVEAGLDREAAMRAVAVANTLDNCPRCGSETQPANGARCCGVRGWDERRDDLPARRRRWPGWTRR